MVAEFISRKGTQFAAHFTLMLGSLRGLRIKKDLSSSIHLSIYG